MRTVFDLERLATDKWRLRVARADERGNVAATAPVDGSLEQVRTLAAKSIRAWSAADEMLAEAKREIAKRNRGRR
jgi:hypothetical protein